MDDYQQELTLIAILVADIQVGEAWLPYFRYGGNQDVWVVDAYLNGLMPLPAHDCDLLALVLNERLTDLHLPRLASYRGQGRITEHGPGDVQAAQGQGGPGLDVRLSSP